MDLEERGLQRERALARIGRATTTSLELETLLRGALAVLGEAVRFKGGSVCLLNDEDELEIAAAVGLLDDEARAVRLPRGTGIVGWVLEHGEPFLSNDLDGETRVALPTRATGTNNLIRSYLAAPLIAGDRVIGVLQIDSDRPDAFSAADVELLAAVASQIAGAVRNARLFAGVRAERERLRTVIREMPEAVAIVDASGAILQANAAAERLWGRRFDPGAVSVIDEALPICHPDGRPMTAEERPFREALRGETVRNVEMLVRRADGGHATVLGSAAPLHDPTGAVDGAVVIYKDVTQLKDVERLKDEFLATASHDLRNPLTTVKGMVQLLRRRLDRSEALEPDAVRKHLTTIERQVDRLGEMLDTLLDVSRIQMGRLVIEHEPVDLAALVAESVEHHRLATSTHELRLALPPGPAVVLGDRSRLLQVIENLVGNAIKYSPDGGPVDVAVRVEDANVTVSVRDEGIGVAPSALPHLFDRFYRTDAVRGRQLEGTGLGLYISRGIVEAHDGQIYAESAGEGQGTRIWFALPHSELSK